MVNNSRVTLRDLYTLSEKIRADLDEVKKCHHEQMEALSVRITALETWKAVVMGKVTLIIGAISLVFTIVWEYFKSRFEK